MGTFIYDWLMSMSEEQYARIHHYYVERNDYYLRFFTPAVGEARMWMRFMGPNRDFAPLKGKGGD